MKWYQLDKKDIINYLLLSMLSLLYILPIVLINLYFKDDLGWSLRGSIGLKGDGRPLGEYLVLTLCGGEPVTDTAPLPLVLAVLFYPIHLFCMPGQIWTSYPTVMPC